MTKKQAKTNKIILFALVAVVAIAGIAIIARTANAETQTLKAFSYEIGAIDSTGEFVQDTSSIVTKKMSSVDKMSIEIEKDALVTYKVYYYDKDGAFISADETENSEDYAGTVPEKAAYFKVVVTPTNDAEVSLFEVAQYAKQLTVTCAK